MKKLILLLSLSLTLMANELHWLHSYKEAIAKAQEMKKPLLVFMSRPGCKSCEFMKTEVFTDEKVKDYLSKHYIYVNLDIHTNDAPKALQVQVTPVFHFLKSDGSMLKETLYGGKTAPFFVKLLQLH